MAGQFIWTGFQRSYITGLVWWYPGRYLGRLAATWAWIR